MTNLRGRNNTEMNAKCQFITDVATKEFGYEDMMTTKQTMDSISLSLMPKS